LNTEIKKETASRHWRQVENITSDHDISSIYFNTFDRQNKPAHGHIDANYGSVNEAALELFDLGLNVLPVKWGKKKPIGPWKILMSTRLPREAIDSEFRKVNLGVLTGRLSRNLFVVDCDSRASFDDERERLNSFGLAKWVVNTHKGGHIWLFSVDGEVQNFQQGGIEIWGRKHYVLAPPSIHPSGDLYQWHRREGEHPPMLTARMIEQLYPGLKVRRQSRQFLPPTAEKVLVQRDLGKYLTWSEAEYSSVLSLVRARYTDQEIIGLFQEYRPPHFSSKKEPEDWLLTYMINPAREEIGLGSSTYRHQIDRVITWAENRPWPGRIGLTDRKVFLACCERAQIESVDSFRASQRETAEKAGVHKDTAKRALKRLCEAGLIKKVVTDDLAHHFALRLDEIERRTV
jgi:hypothetical protein